MGIKLQTKSSQHILDVMKSQGFEIEQEFLGTKPMMPFDITDLDDLGIMRLWQEYNAYLAFILAQVTCAQIDESNAKKALELVEAQAMAKHTAPKLTVSAVKAMASSEPDVRESEKDYYFTSSYRKGMEMMYTNVKMDCDFISRELTRRTSSGFSRSSKFTT